MLDFTQIKETCLYIDDLDTAQRFYGDGLGMPVISKVEGRHIFFRVGASVLLCFIPEVTRKEQNLPPHFAKGKQHIAFEVPLEQYAAWKEKLHKLGIPITHEQDWGKNRTSIYFEDPFGHVLEILPPGIWDAGA
jgi:catechol 2,3-dioxygenase-like lactoylglutathione lyase family enzyme